MQVERLGIPDVAVIRPRRFADDRGYFSETYVEKRFADAFGATAFIQDNEALSTAVGTVRGLHFQRPPNAQGKLVRVPHGAVLDVAVDLRTGSPTYGKAVWARLDAAEGAQLWVPPGFAHGYCTLEPDTVVTYKVDAPYSPADEGGVLWSDPALGIPWPVDPGRAVVSDRDVVLPALADLPPLFTYAAGEGAR